VLRFQFFDESLDPHEHSVVVHHLSPFLSRIVWDESAVIVVEQVVFIVVMAIAWTTPRRLSSATWTVAPIFDVVSAVAEPMLSHPVLGIVAVAAFFRVIQFFGLNPLAAQMTTRPNPN
jgi:hypothetical protein